MAERNGLLNRRTSQSVPRVRIPLSPPCFVFCNQPSMLFRNGRDFRLKTFGVLIYPCIMVESCSLYF